MLEVLQLLTKNLISNNYYRDGTEITAEEYAAAVEAIQTKAAWINNICNGTAKIVDAPVDWQTEIQQRVAERQAQAEDDPELTAEEALSIIVGGTV